MVCEEEAKSTNIGPRVLDQEYCSMLHRCKAVDISNSKLKRPTSELPTDLQRQFEATTSLISISFRTPKMGGSGCSWMPPYETFVFFFLLICVEARVGVFLYQKHRRSNLRNPKWKLKNSSYGENN